MKVIAFRPEKGEMERFEETMNALGISQSELAREVFICGLPGAFDALIERKRSEAIETLKRLKHFGKLQIHN